MIKQKGTCTILPKANVLDFMEHKKRKPHFAKPLRVSVGPPISDTYVMLKNIVYMDKQILALRSNEDPKTILFAEATIEQGQLTEISKVPEQYIADLIKLFGE